MKVLFDTSVLIAAMLPDHKFHGSAATWLSQAKRQAFEFLVSGHSLAEVYAVLTRLPRKPQITPEEARQLLQENVISQASIITLSGENYTELIDELAQNKMSGGIVYDAVIAKAAEQAKVDHLLTFNVAHFQRVWPAGHHLITSPDSMAPPSS